MTPEPVVTAFTIPDLAWMVPWLSLAVAVFALVRTARWQPRPDIVIEWGPSPIETQYGVLAVGLRVWNTGDVTARNLTFDLRDVPGVTWDDDHWGRIHELKPGESADQWHIVMIPLEPCERVAMQLGEWDLIREQDASWGETRENVLRPLLTVKYRGRFRRVRSRAPKYDGTPGPGGC